MDKYSHQISRIFHQNIVNIFYQYFYRRYSKMAVIYLILKSLKPMFRAIVRTVGDVVTLNELLNV